MKNFICFVIAMTLIYIIKFVTGGLDAEGFLSYFLMVALLGSHVYFSTRKRAIFGIVIPIVIVASFYPIYQLMHPTSIKLAVLIGMYVIVLGMLFFIWYQVRKNDNRSQSSIQLKLEYQNFIQGALFSGKDSFVWDGF